MDDLTPYEDLGPTHRSTCGGKPTPRLQPSAITRRIISELGLRYRPSAQADLEAHAALISLLAVDVAEVDPRDLDVAVRKHVARCPFMPKASELLELADEARCNREFAERPPLPAIEYQPHVREVEPPEPPCTPEAAAKIMAEYGISSDSLPKTMRHLGRPKMPTREDYIAMGVDPASIGDRAA